MRNKLQRNLTALFLFAITCVVFQNCSQSGFKLNEYGQHLSSQAAGAITVVKNDFLSYLDLVPKSTSPKAHSLSRFELLNAAQDLIGDSSLEINLIANLPSDPKVSGFDSAATQIYDTDFFEGRLAFIEEVATRAINAGRLIPCALPANTVINWDGCVRDAIVKTAYRAYRRPLATQEESALRDFFNAEVTAVKKETTDSKTVSQEVLRSMLVRIMLSTNFQFRRITIPEGMSTAQAEAFKLANHLALFLTSSIPDETLLTLAAENKLGITSIYEQQVDRLIQKGAQRFSFNTLGQWLGFRELAIKPKITDLEKSMVQESTLVFKEIIDQNLQIQSILTPGFTMADQRLGQHYALARKPASAAFEKVFQNERGGILSQGSLLTLTASGSTTKPITRGKYIQWTLLCRSVPSPNLSLREEIDRVAASADPGFSVSQRLEYHRKAGPVCFSCHQFMDPLGLALENYGPTGLWRKNYEDGKPVVASGELFEKPFTDVNQLVEQLAPRREFKGCVATKLLTQALARPLEVNDSALIYKLTGENETLKELMRSIALSNSFLLAAGEGI